VPSPRDGKLPTVADRGLRAPAWLEELVRTKRPPVPWRDVVRFAVTIPLPLVVAVAITGGIRPSAALGAGVFATTGALAATLAPTSGPLRDRMRRIIAAAAFGGLGLVVGKYAIGGGWQPVLVIAVLAALAALISGINVALSLGSLQLLVYTALASGLVSPLPHWVEVAFFLAGAGWATLTTLLQAATETLDPDRTAVAAVFTRTGGLLQASGGDAAEDARRELTRALNEAYDRVIRSRSLSSGRSRELSELAGVLNAAAPLVEGAVAAARAGVTADPRDVAAVEAVAAAIAGDRPLGEGRPPAVDEGPPARKAVRHGLRLVWNVVGDPEERAGAVVAQPRPDLPTRLRDLVDRTVGSADVRAFAVRLALCMAVAEVVRQHLTLPRPYWVVLTVAIVLVLGYLLWPQTWRAPLDEAMRDTALALDAFVEAAFTGNPTELRRARRRNYRALTELQTQLQRRLAEPPPISTRAAAWWPVIVQLERTSDAVTEAVIATRGGEPSPDLAQVAVLRRAIRQLEDDVRAHRAPDDDAEIMADGVLAPVAREVDAARRLVRENAPGRRDPVTEPAD
jgi:uncharacterized membrane protein YccC